MCVCVSSVVGSRAQEHMLVKRVCVHAVRCVGVFPYLKSSLK